MRVPDSLHVFLYFVNLSITISVAFRNAVIVVAIKDISGQMH